MRFFGCFLRNTFVKWKKKSWKKKTLAPTQLFIEKTNVSIPYENQSHFFFKTCPGHHTHRLFPHPYNRTRFYQKNTHGITILHRNLVGFSIFSGFSICQPILILQFHAKIDEQYLCKSIFFIFGKITICNINYHENLICIAGFNIFWIISSKSICFNPFRNIGFLCIYEENS